LRPRLKLRLLSVCRAHGERQECDGRQARNTMHLVEIGIAESRAQDQIVNFESTRFAGVRTLGFGLWRPRY